MYQAKSSKRKNGSGSMRPHEAEKENTISSCWSYWEENLKKDCPHMKKRRKKIATMNHRDMSQKCKMSRRRRGRSLNLLDIRTCMCVCVCIENIPYELLGHVRFQGCYETCKIVLNWFWYLNMHMYMYTYAHLYDGWKCHDCCTQGNKNLNFGKLFYVNAYKWWL